jgi:hypothetical protein
LHSKWYLDGKDEAPEAYTQYVEDAKDEANDSDTMNANWNKYLKPGIEKEDKGRENAPY